METRDAELVYPSSTTGRTRMKRLPYSTRYFGAPLDSNPLLLPSRPKLTGGNRLKGCVSGKGGRGRGRARREQQRLTRQEETVDVLPIVAEGHLLLSKTDSIFSGADSIEGLEICLVDASEREVDIHSI